MVRFPLIQSEGANLSKIKDQRVAIFLDIQNLYHSAKHLFEGGRPNYKNIVLDALRERKLVRAIGYVVRSGTEEERAFFDTLKDVGIELKVKDLQVFLGGAKKADWDVGMTLDIIAIAPSVDVIVLASGDGDFIPLFERLKHLGKIVEVAAFFKSAATRLIEVTDAFLDLGADPKRYIIKKK